jgi:hypothetical protein
MRSWHFLLGSVLILIALPLEAQINRSHPKIEADTTQKFVDSRGTISADSLAKLPLAERCAYKWQTADKEYEAFGCVWRRLRLSNSEQAREYFGSFGVGDAIGLSLADDQASLHTELLSDNIYLFQKLGYARVGLATQVSTSDDRSGATTVDQFFQGGGNAMLYAELPLRVRITYAGDPAKPSSPVRRFDSAATLSLGVDVPELSGPATASASYGRIGVQTTFTWRSEAEVFRFFLLGNVGYTYGFTDSFYQNLGGESIEGAPGAGMLAGTITTGVDLARVVRIGVRFGTSTFEPVQQKPRFVIQVLSK